MKVTLRERMGAMHSLRLVNMKNYKYTNGEVLVRCDRKSVLGNPFFMEGKSPEERIKVCNQYQDYFDIIVGRKSANDCSNTASLAKYLTKASADPSFEARFKAELQRIEDLLRVTDVAIGCWCYPLRCHTDTIFNYLKSRIIPMA